MTASSPKRCTYNLQTILMMVALHVVTGLGSLLSYNSAAAEDARCPDVGELLRHRCNALSTETLYTGEVFSNTRGGISTNGATQYQGLLDIGLSVDFEKTQLSIPGKFALLAQNTHGRGLTEDFIGDTQVISNIDSFTNIMQVSEYWWEFELLDGDLTFRLGKQDVNTEFLFIDTAADFVQSTFGLSPSTAFPTFPDPSMGALVLAQLTESWRLKMGVWDAFAKGSSWGFSGNNSILVVGELEKSYALAGGSLPGVFAIGAVYESSGRIDGRRVSAVHEYIFQIEQSIYRECPCESEDDQGLSAFAGYYPRFPGDEIIDESIGDSFVAGLTYTGLIAGRDADVIGVGVAYSELFQGGTNREIVTEVFYKAEITPRLSLQPDLQFISSPSGIHPDALALGLRFQVGL